MTERFIRIISIDPTKRGFAYASLEKRNDLIDFGLVQPIIRTDATVLSRVEAILARARAHILVLEDGRGTKRGERVQRLIKKIDVAAKRRGLRVVRVSRSRVKYAFAPAKNKEEVAELLAKEFPALHSRFPRRRRPGDGEDPRMRIFDAVAFALAAVV
jgi:hypothetical protein